MPLFEYEAVDPKTVEIMGQMNIQNVDEYTKALEKTVSIEASYIEANNPQDVAEELNKRGMIPVRIELIDTEGNAWMLAKLRKQRRKFLGLDKKPNIPETRKVLRPGILAAYIAIVSTITYVIMRLILP
jgi:hypothetical protein